MAAVAPAAGVGWAEQALLCWVVKGPTLADRIRQGAIPLEEALPSQSK